jgi:hypothetical protein
MSRLAVDAQDRLAAGSGLSLSGAGPVEPIV